MNDLKAFEVFKNVRWSSNGKLVCPYCGSHKKRLQI
ncbi:MAG: transposase [Candidatus Marinarcus sp.]